MGQPMDQSENKSVVYNDAIHVQHRLILSYDGWV